MFKPCFKKPSWFKSSSGSTHNTCTHSLTHTHMHTLGHTTWWSHKPTVFPLRLLNWQNINNYSRGAVVSMKKSWLSVSRVNNWICRMAAQIYEEEWNKKQIPHASMLHSYWFKIIFFNFFYLCRVSHAFPVHLHSDVVTMVGSWSA
jgi:hypothetical protein